jgi:hypothetical protein
MPTPTRKSPPKPAKKTTRTAKAAKTSRPAAKTRAAARPRKSAPAKKAPAKKAPEKKAAAKKALAAKTPAKRRVATPTPIVHRRAIFIDVENTSNEAALNKVLESLQIDRAGQPTEVFAIGNWRAIGLTMSRHLARLGATLVHSAPMTGVKDWSDLWIAVAAGRWIAMAVPGDILEIVSDDKAFEAVGDAAATAGVVFRRVLHRSGSARTATATETAAEGTAPRRRRRGGRGRRRGNGEAPGPGTSRAAHPRAETSADTEPPRNPAPRRSGSRRSRPAPRPTASAPAAVSPATSVDDAAGDAHGATQEQVVATIRRLTGGDPARQVNLDSIANALKGEGFTRRPGSPRLVVRLRRMKDVEVNPSGMVRLLA